MEMLQEIRELILATDMTNHKKVLDSFESQIKSGFKLTDPEHMTTVRHVETSQQK